MASLITNLLLAIVVLYVLKHLLLDPFLISPLKHIPGPKIFAVTKWRLAYEDWKGTRTRIVHDLHQQYGPVVRIGPNEISFNSLTALRTIFGPGSRYGRTSFYWMFEVYDRQNMFSFHSSKEHGDRKRLLANSYSKSTILQKPVTAMVEEKVKKYMSLIEHEPDHISEVYTTLHYYSLDNITAFLYGKHGATSAIEGSESDRALIQDLLNPTRRRLSWFTVHFPTLTKWLYTRSGLMERVVAPLLPMQKPAAFTGVRNYALTVSRRSRTMAPSGEKAEALRTEPVGVLPEHIPLIDQLSTLSVSGKAHMDDLEIASECADHLLAGIDTTSDTIMFVIWSLSLPKNEKFQARLRQEVLGLPSDLLNSYGFPTAKASDSCEYLKAVIKETLRLYAPLPTFEPRSMSEESKIDGFTIPAHTTVGISPYTLHRNPEIFKDSQSFNPERWLGPQSTELNRWFWAFSSGGRMCIGMHLAWVEMITLVATIYRNYKTSIAAGYEDCTPGVTARFELFFDERYHNVQEHFCRIKFEDATD
ncbi:hypothetical protein FDECE_10128 [Fusarium decemcellulare]|nr:hypothetical protein FDECE_10128 [Fusarium decemcellulare]